MKKIAIAGSHGVGKTTLAYALSNSLGHEKVTVNSQVARTLIKNGYPLGRDATEESYIRYIISQLQAEQVSKECGVFISDRTLLDPLAYAIVNRELIGSSVPDSIIDLLRAVWLLELRQYNLYVFVPVEFGMQSDGIRPEGETYREKVGEQIHLLLDEYGVDYITVSGTTAHRAAQVCEALLRRDS